MKNRSLLFILAVSVLLSLVSCSKKEKVEFGYITFYIGDVKIKRSGDLFGKTKPRLKMLVQSGDVVYTGDNGRIDIQLQKFGLIRVNQNSRVEMEKMIRDVNESIDLGLDRGQVLCKVLKLKKKQEFNVHTPTAVAGVRGTTFLVDAQKDQKKSEVAVQNGEVEVKDKKDPEKKVMVKQNQTAKVDWKTKAMDLAKNIDKDNLKEFKAIKDVKMFKDIKSVKLDTLKSSSLKNLKKVRNIKSLKELDLKDLKSLGDEFSELKSLIPGAEKKEKEDKEKEKKAPAEKEAQKEEKKPGTIEETKKKAVDKAKNKAQDAIKDKLKNFKF
jgi:hypothetical protein